jgi:5-methylcytosine-specific restriction endonuclease McrA
MAKNGRTCRDCGTHYEDVEASFYARPKKGWVAPECKACTKARERQRYAEKRPEIRAKAKERYATDRDVILQRNRESRARYPERNRQRAKEYYASHREEAAAYWKARYASVCERYRERSRQWRLDNPVRAAERDRLYYAKNRVAIRSASKEKYRADPEHCRVSIRRYKARKLRAPGSHTKADIRAQMERQKGRCFWCKKALSGRYHVDHVIPLSKGGDNGPGNLVCACPHCNLTKHAKMPAEFAGRFL